MGVPAAFSDLMEVSSQVEAAIVLEGDEVIASSLTDKNRSEQLGAAIRRLVESAEKTRAELRQLEVVLPSGSVFVVREGQRLLGAATSPDPPSGLVFYDLRSCLSGLATKTAAKDDAAK
jgi:predicted regulator of Ras-like GTPase activity (Roadblock/LC7/MglB family)